MCNPGILSLPFPVGLLGLTRGIWLDASQSKKKIAFLFQEVFQCLKNQIHCTCISFLQTKAILKITQACIKINVKFIRYVIFTFLAFSLELFGNRKFISVSMNVCACVRSL